MNYAVGSLVRAREREWVVLPESSDELLILRPLGGTQAEVTGIFTALEAVVPAQFDLPDPAQPGDARSCRLLRDAVRLGFRSSAGPFRSFGRIDVEPRPYQLVPLLMALKLDPVRLLVADDVGIGKTVEAALIARELLDRGEIQRLAVLCPPPLAEQWQAELRSKFYIEAEVVLPSTATRLERACHLGQSLFDVYPFVIVSTDFIKAERRRDEFIRTCPELVIVDEAHTCAYAGEGRGGRHQRYELVSRLAQHPDRHMLLVTATPHSGNEAAFRSLLGLLHADFQDLPEDLTGKENETFRRQLARYFVQRRRGDIRAYMDAKTPFPNRQDAEATYKLTDPYHRLFEKVLRYARETVQEPTGPRQRQRVLWWSALALLRSVASSPAAAAATLRNRAATADAATEDEIEDIGRRTVLDLTEDETAEGSDVAPGSDVGDLAANETGNRRRLLDMAREADALLGEGDAKLLKAVDLIKGLLKEGYAPIVFCRYIPTVDYLVTELRARLRGVEVVGVTGSLPPAERAERVNQLGQADPRVLVCTDCLSEGVNLQHAFNAVVHYDLSWNPTRHEQREGRVDRYGQPRPTVRVLTYYGLDNQIDGIVLDVLVRKHHAIRDRLGISVPVPVDSDAVIEAIFEGLLLREDSGAQLALTGLEEYIKPQKDKLYKAWEAAEEREKQSRTMFAQQTIKVDDVARELQEARAAVGSGVDVAHFVTDAARVFRGTVAQNGSLKVDLTEAPRGLRESIGNLTHFDARFELPVKDNELLLTRTSPVVEGLASYVMDNTLDPQEDAPARRCGVMRTTAVARRTTVLLVRFRYHIVTQTKSESHQLLAEDCQLVGFAGAVNTPEWIVQEEADMLLAAEPDDNIQPAQATNFLGQVLVGFETLRPHLDDIARQRGQELLDAHMRVRSASNIRGVKYSVEPQLPPDVLGIYIYLPGRKQGP